MSEEKGFLTETDERFVLGKHEGYSSKQSRYQRRNAIRERTRRAFYDFRLLHHNLDNIELQKIFSPPDDEVQPLKEEIVATIAFLYHALETGADTDTTRKTQKFPYFFSQLLEEGVRQGELARQKRLGNYPFDGNIDLTFEVEVTQPQPMDIHRAAESLAKNGGAGLTDEELRGAILSAVNQTWEIEAQRNIGGDASEGADDRPEVGLRKLAALVEQEVKKLDDEGKDE